MDYTKKPLKSVKIDREEIEDSYSVEGSTDIDPNIQRIRELVNDLDKVQDFGHKVGVVGALPNTIGYAECPTCGYGCEGLFINGTTYPNDETMDDYCPHLKHVDRDYAYFEWLN